MTGKPANPVGGWVMLVAAGMILIGAFLPTHTLVGPIEHNAFVADGDWYVLAAPLGLGIGAAYILRGICRGRVGLVIVSLIALAIGVWGLTNEYQTLTYVSGGLSGQQVRATPGIGVYLVLAGAVVALVGIRIAGNKGLPAPVDGMKECPDCAETVLVGANVCKHCGYRFAPTPVEHA